MYQQQYHGYAESYVASQFKFQDGQGRYLLRNFYSAGDGPARHFFGKLIPPPEGHHWRYTQEKIDQLIAGGRIALDRNGFPKLKMYLHEAKGKPYMNLLDEMHVVQGSSTEFWNFPTQNPEKLIKLFILSSSNESDLVMDFFLGSGTTTAVAHKLGRKWLGVEMGEHFYTVVLPRMKKVLAYDKSGISKELRTPRQTLSDTPLKEGNLNTLSANADTPLEERNYYSGGGFFKYYELEQYEDALRKVKYEDSDLFDNPYEDPYSQYVFMRDLKMLEALEIDYENNKVKVDLAKLYEHVDVPETLSNLCGKWIKKITPTLVEFENGEKVDTKNLDYKLIKPLIWW
jgi:hypothetical protein